MSLGDVKFIVCPGPSQRRTQGPCGIAFDAADTESPRVVLLYRTPRTVVLPNNFTIERLDLAWFYRNIIAQKLSEFTFADETYTGTVFLSREPLGQGCFGNDPVRSDFSKPPMGKDCSFAAAVGRAYTKNTIDLCCDPYRVPVVENCADFSAVHYSEVICA